MHLPACLLVLENCSNHEALRRILQTLLILPLLPPPAPYLL